MIDCEQDVNRALIYIQLDDLLELLLSDLTDSGLDLRHLPDEDLTISCASDSLFGAWQEDRLRVRFILLGRVVLADSCSVVLERLRLIGPLHEEDTVLAVTGELVRVHRVEFDPMG